MFAGIDIGSVSSKAAVIDESGQVLAFCVIPTSYDRDRSGQEVFDLALKKMGALRSAIKYVLSTGYGRRAFTSSNGVLPEIVCHAMGTRWLLPDARTIIDIGGQDSKVIEMDDQGNVMKFDMNDKCAAGTGRFLEVLTDRILGVSLDELGPLSLKSQDPCTLSSTCTVFAESEIVSLLSMNRSKEDVARGMHLAIARRVVSMGTGSQIRYTEPVVFTGGVAKNVGVVAAIEEVLGKKVVTLKDPQITGALGAAIFAKQQARQYAAR